MPVRPIHVIQARRAPGPRRHRSLHRLGRRRGFGLHCCWLLRRQQAPGPGTDRRPEPEAPPLAHNKVWPRLPWRSWRDRGTGGTGSDESHQPSATGRQLLTVRGDLKNDGPGTAVVPPSCAQRADVSRAGPSLGGATVVDFTSTSATTCLATRTGALSPGSCVLTQRDELLVRVHA